MANAAPPLDEIQWRTPPVEFDGGIHSNSVLFYFALSPFFDNTSNNAVVFQQGLSNPHMMTFLSTREQFEGRLRMMSGLEFIVAQEPAETAPGTGTGVWVINKQTRRKRGEGEEDEVVVHGTYFIVGENIYMAPSLADIISSRIAFIASSVDKLLPTADAVQTWSPGLGRTYQPPPKALPPSKPTTTSPFATNTDDTISAPTTRLAEEALAIHQAYGDQYMDENPITGKPGEFHLSSTGRKVVNLAAAAAAKGGPAATAAQTLPALNTKVGADGGAANSNNPLAKKEGSSTKSPRTPGAPKPKRRKSKVAVTPS